MTNLNKSTTFKYSEYICVLKGQCNDILALFLGQKAQPVPHINSQKRVGEDIREKTCVCLVVDYTLTR